jgi:hypothetical protein
VIASIGFSAVPCGTQMVVFDEPCAELKGGKTKIAMARPKRAALRHPSLAILQREGANAGSAYLLDIAEACGAGSLSGCRTTTLGLSSVTFGGVSASSSEC